MRFPEHAMLTGDGIATADADVPARVESARGGRVAEVDSSVSPGGSLVVLIPNMGPAARAVFAKPDGKEITLPTRRPGVVYNVASAEPEGARGAILRLTCSRN